MLQCEGGRKWGEEFTVDEKKERRSTFRCILRFGNLPAVLFFFGCFFSSTFFVTLDCSIGVRCFLYLQASPSLLWVFPVIILRLWV